ncbi:MAG: 30S ribosomal protein S6 [Clostridia bacterium]|nr:30S ribosomal protein S6 [Clostridia bacterium]
MEKIKNSYETLFIVDSDLGEEAVRALIDKFTSLIAANGEIEKVDEWGKRRLAYPINDKPEGYYVLVNHKCEGDFPAELERIFGITDGIMRSMVIRLDEKAIAAAKKAAAAPVAEAEEAPAEAVTEE